MEGMLNYFVPEDGDSSDHMNVVPLPRVEQLKLLHVKKCFPLPGDFHFRFKTAFEGTYVWLDVTNDADPVPDYNGLIISKIARVQRANTTRPPERVEAAAAPTPNAKPAPDLIETSPSPAAKAPEPPQPAKAFNDDLVGLLSDPIPTSPRTSTPPAPAAAVPPPNPSGAPTDPFNLFMGPPNNAPMGRPNVPSPMHVPRGPPGPGGFQGGGFNAMGGPGSVPSPMNPRPGGNMGMGISQMGQHMGMNQGQPPQGNSFQGLNWQGMGGQQQQPPRPGMGMPQNGRQW